MKELPNGIWSQWQANQYHQSSPKLAAWLVSYLPKEEHVIDFGCGNAFYLGELAKQGFKCTGVEGTKLNNFLHDNVLIHDLTQPIHLVAKGSVICLEVLEHIDKKYEHIVLNSIAEHCTGNLILSWALPSQPGIGHVNCQPKDYVIDQLKERGFAFDHLTTEEARKNIDENCSWFTRTLLVFSRI